jgi:ribosomal protein S18 acetylase RimI-like enzyme
MSKTERTEMSEAITVERGGMELLPETQPLWEALYDRHLEYGAAGLATIEREHSWPRRLAHYKHIFAERPHPTVLLARLDGEAIGYALGYEEEHLGESAVVLETLSLLPAVRGRGLGTRLMDLIDREARERGATHSIVDVVSGNTPAFGFYLKSGFAPYSERWMRSEMPQSDGHELPDDIADRSRRLGLHFDTAPGPDDTWVSSDRMADLSLIPDNDEEPAPDTAALQELFEALESSGLWSIQVTIPTAPRSEAWRETLKSLRFKTSMERLTRPI